MNDTRSAIKVINQMQADGVIGKYAIGGAIAAAFYIEATSTYDIDVFIPFEIESGSSLVSLTPIYNYLAKLGYAPDGANILMENWPVQFLPG